MQQTQKNPKLTLVGAGPGDPELITVKALNALKNADVVLYDALSNSALLDYAPLDSEKIFVGKRGGFSQMEQDEINQLIVAKALENKNVVRLKGGDPFIFGRGHEELTFAKTYGIETIVVPGISSSLALAELQHIPLTKRGINESFWVTTGVTRNGNVSKDIVAASNTSATLVILMGMTNLPAIVAIFQKRKKGNTPVALIQNGSLPTEKIGLGTIDTILQTVKTQQLSSPAVIVIGEVVRLHEGFGK